MEELKQNKTKQLTRKQIISLFFAKFPIGKPLNQMFIEPKALLTFLSLLLKKEQIQVRESSNGTGFLLLCPQCGKQNKLFYSYDGRMFLCLDYQKCGWKCHKLVKLKKAIHKWAKTRTNSLNTGETNEVYVDYALHGKIGIWSDNPYLRISYQPEDVKINWQIEGEALAIKQGVSEFLKHKKKEQKKLVIYTDNKTLLHSFHSKTQAGEWWKQAQQIAEKNEIHLELKFISGQKNFADQLTRDTRVTSIQSANLAKADNNSHQFQGDYNTVRNKKHAK